MIEVIGLIVGCGFFPCLLFGVIVLISFLTCDYIEKFVVKTFCSFKNRRRRFRDKGSLQPQQAKPSRKGGKSDKSGSSAGVQRRHTQHSVFNLSDSPPDFDNTDFPSPDASLSPSTTLPHHQQTNTLPPRSTFDDPPPAYYECMPRPPPQNPTPTPTLNPTSTPAPPLIPTPTPKVNKE